MMYTINLEEYLLDSLNTVREIIYAIHWFDWYIQEYILDKPLLNTNLYGYYRGIQNELQNKLTNTPTT